MFGPYNNGYGQVFGWGSCRPLKNPVSRNEGAAICHANYATEPGDLAEWQKGYDAGLEACKRYKEGYEAGLVNGPDENPYKHLTHNERSVWAWGYDAGRRLFLRQTLKPIIKAHTPWDLVLYAVHYPQDDPTGQTEDYGGGESYKPLTRKDVLTRAIDTLMDRWCRKDPVPTDFDTILKYAVNEDGDECGYERVITRKEMKKEKAQKEYAEMEEAAQQFAGSCGHKLGTFQFIRALEKAVDVVRDQREQWNNPEVRMEEWAACQYAGVGQAVYFDDLNFENGRYSNRLTSLGQVWDYLERKFPILMMRYKEWKARRRKEKRSDKEG